MRGLRDDARADDGRRAVSRAWGRLGLATSRLPGVLSVGERAVGVLHGVAYPLRGVRWRSHPVDRPRLARGAGWGRAGRGSMPKMRRCAHGARLRNSGHVGLAPPITVLHGKRYFLPTSCLGGHAFKVALHFVGNATRTSVHAGRCPDGSCKGCRWEGDRGISTWP